MTKLGLGIYVLTIAACGLALSAALLPGTRPRRLVDVAALSAALGCGAVPILFLWASMLGIRPGPSVLVCIAFLAAASITISGLRRRLPRIARPLCPRLRKMELPLLLPAVLLLAVQATAITSTAALLPAHERDTIAIWGLKAKVLHHEPLTPQPAYFHDLSLSYSHLDYPLLVPMLWAGAYSAVGAVADPPAKAVFLVPALGLLLMLYSALRDVLPRDRAAILTALAAGAPAMTRWAGEAIADATMGLLLLSAAAGIARWLREDEPRHALLAGAFSVLAALTKLEGIVPVAAVLGVGVAAAAMKHRRRSRRIGFLLMLAAIAALLIPWLIWSRNLPHSHEDYASRLGSATIVHGFDRLPQLCRIAIEQLGWWSRGALLILPLAATIGWRGFGRGEVLGVWFILLMQLIACIIAYLITPWDLAELMPMTVSRLLLHLLPLAGLLAGLHWGRIGDDWKSNDDLPL